MHFEIYQGKPGTNKGTWRWHLIADNNSDIIADSGEAYVRIEDCVRGIDLVKRSATAEVRDGRDRRAGLGGILDAYRTPR